MGRGFIFQWIKLSDHHEWGSTTYGGEKKRVPEKKAGLLREARNEDYFNINEREAGGKKRRKGLCTEWKEAEKSREKKRDD